MSRSEELEQIFHRIEQGQQTLEDINALRQGLLDGDREIATQLGKYNIKIGQGQEIHIGDRIYKQWDKKAIKALVKKIKKVRGIHQNTHSGDAAGRDVDKRITYENCTFIPLLLKDRDVSNSSPECFQDLVFADIPQESIQKAYQNSLPPDADIWDLKGNNIEQILTELDAFRQLPQFYERLSQDRDVPSSKKLESYLLATVIPDDRGHFFLNAWLIIDDSVRDLSKFQSLLDPQEPQQGILCKLMQVPTEFNKFLKRALKLLRGKKYCLIIEFFLPSDLMCTEVDRWQIADPITEEITLGIKYPIRLRSLERLNLDYLDSYLPQWYEYWDKVRNILPQKLNPELFEHLEEMDGFNWKLLRSNLKEKIGLKVTCAHPQYIRKDLFRAILQATTPIGIWTRTDITHLDRVTAIDEILTSKPLCHLCESVRTFREKADAQTEEHLGFHLAILWENPYRLTPDLMELIPPGQ